MSRVLERVALLVFVVVAAATVYLAMIGMLFLFDMKYNPPQETTTCDEVNIRPNVYTKHDDIVCEVRMDSIDQRITVMKG